MWTNVGKSRPAFALPTHAGQESCWDYPRPPAIVQTSRLVSVHLNSIKLAESSRSIRILETASPPTFYIPRSDVKMELLKKVQRSSFCEYKGMASYYAYQNEVIAWSYENINPEYKLIGGMLSFYAGKSECAVDGEKVKAQASDFYGGTNTF